jgi:orotate phosphoribosyltransferase
MIDLLKGEPFEYIGGPTLGADPFLGAFNVLAFQAKKDIKTFIIRKAPKPHGRQQQIEGPEIPTGTNVILVRQVSLTPPPITIIKYADEMDRAMAEPLTTMFGEIVFEKATERVEGIDVQVILGDSFVNFLATGAKPDPNINPEDLAVNAADALTTETTP